MDSHLRILVIVSGCLALGLFASCGAWLGPDGTCEHDYECFDDEHCLWGRCEPLGEEGEYCLYNSDCSPTLFCRKDDNMCAPRGTTDSPCASLEDCDAGLDCYAAYHYARDDVCLPPGVHGYPCPNGKPDCASGFDCSGFFSPTCHKEYPAEPPPPANFDCDHNSDCPGALVCNWGYDPGKCTPLQALGGTCAHDTECNYPYYCDVDAGYCRERAQEGEHCSTKGWSSITPCAEGLHCETSDVESVCAPPRQAGEPCLDGSWCASQLECGYAAHRAICEPAPVGAQCGFLPDDTLASGVPCIISQPMQTCRPSDGKELLVITVVFCEPGLVCSTATDPPTCAPKKH